MKKSKLIALAGIIAFFVFSSALAGIYFDNRGERVAAEYFLAGKPLYAESVCLYAADRDEILFAYNEDVLLAPASTVKLLAALTALDYCGMNEIVHVGREVELIAADSSRAWLYPNDLLSLRQVITAMLLPSGNDAAYALAAHCGDRLGGSNLNGKIAEFVNAMNRKARSMGLTQSNFINPDGYDAVGQLITAKDMAVIATAFCRNEELVNIAGSFCIEDTWYNGRDVIYYNTNALLDPSGSYYYPEAIGLKTGTSTQAGGCLTAAARIDGELYIAVVLGSGEESRFSDCITLFESVK